MNTEKGKKNGGFSYVQEPSIMNTEGKNVGVLVVVGRRETLVEGPVETHPRRPLGACLEK